MTIIVTEICITVDVVASYFHEKNMIENGLFVIGGPETHLHDILWAVHDVKNRGRSEGEEIFEEFLVMVGGRGREMQCGLCVSLIRACVRGAR